MGSAKAAFGVEVGRGPAHLDVHLGTLQEAQRGVAGAIGAQGHQLLELLQVQPEFGSSEKARNRSHVGWHLWGGGSATQQPRGWGRAGGNQLDFCLDPLSPSPQLPSQPGWQPLQPPGLALRKPLQKRGQWLGPRGQTAQSQGALPPGSLLSRPLQRSPGGREGITWRGLCRALARLPHPQDPAPPLPRAGCSLHTLVSTETRVHLGQGGPRVSTPPPSLGSLWKLLDSRFCPCVQADECGFPRKLEPEDSRAFARMGA